MDKFTPEQRSKIMSAIHSRDTLPEIVVRKWLFANGYRFRVCDKRIVGHPDIVLPRLKTLVEIRGCFWHHHGWEWNGRNLVQTAICSQATAPKSNRAFWNAKFRRNVQRDQEHERLWSEQGWNVIIIWECALKTVAERERTFAKVGKWLKEIETAKGLRPVLLRRRGFDFLSNVLREGDCPRCGKKICGRFWHARSENRWKLVSEVG